MAFPWLAIPALYSAITGSKASNEATARGNEMTDYEKQLFEEFGRPQAEIELERLRASQPGYEYLIRLLQSQMGMPNSEANPAYTEAPAWMRVPQGEVNLPEVPTLGTMPEAYKPNQELYDALNSISRMNLEDYMREQAANRVNLAQSQGIRLSGEQARLAPGVQRGFLDARSREQAKAALSKYGIDRQYAEDLLDRYTTGAGLESTNWGQQLQRAGMTEDIGRSRRGEQSGNFWNLANLASGYAANPSQTATPWANIYGNIAGNYQNQAANYGNMFGQSLNSVATAYGRNQAYKSMNPYESGGNTNNNWLSNVFTMWGK